MLAALSTSRHSAESLAQPARTCPYCCAMLAREAKKCRDCGEWVVGTSQGLAAAALRLIGLLWGAATVLAAGGLWTIGQGIRRWVWLHAVETEITPQVVDLLLYGIVAFVLLMGLMVSVGLGVLARLAPRRPRWWT